MKIYNILYSAMFPLNNFCHVYYLLQDTIHLRHIYANNFEQSRIQVDFTRIRMRPKKKYKSGSNIRDKLDSDLDPNLEEQSGSGTYLILT